MKRAACAIASILLWTAAAPLALADATIPTRDIAGAADSPLLKRYEGSFIVSYERSSYTDLRVPLSRLEQSDDRDAMNNRLFVPARELELEGALTRIVYVLPAERSPLEVLRNYEDEILAAGGEVLFACEGADCGGDPERSSSGGGGDSSLMMYFVYESDLMDEAFSTGACALTESIDDQRFLAAKMPPSSGDATVTVHTYGLIAEGGCDALNGRTIAVVHVLEPEAREKKMVRISADEMARTIGSTGRVALYGIFFDFDKIDIKPESAPTLEEIAALLNGQPALAVLIVGHTDSQGGFDYNLDLSRRRAEAVVTALTTTYGVDPARLRAAGVGMMAPAASNETEDGRAMNRRVELVKLN